MISEYVFFKEGIMSKTGIIIAMEKELTLFASMLTDKSETTLHRRRFIEGNINGRRVVVVVCGIGKVNAAVCAADLIGAFHVDAVVNIGISGGLDDSFDIGDFVVGADIVYHDFDTGLELPQDIPEKFHSDPALTALLPRLRRGLLCCGDQFIIKKDDLMKIKAKFPDAVAVDMESAAIAHACWLYGVPMMSVRQISDTPGVEHHKEQYETFWKNAADKSVGLLKEILTAP